MSPELLPEIAAPIRPDGSGHRLLGRPTLRVPRDSFVGSSFNLDSRCLTFCRWDRRCTAGCMRRFTPGSRSSPGR